MTENSTGPGSEGRSPAGAPRGESAPSFLELDQLSPVPRRPRRSNAAWTLIGCNAIVFVTSICIMVIELVGSRLIAKAIGQSLYTWTSVIGVVLAGLSLGNFTGGWLADRYPPRKLLGWLFWMSSLLCLSIYPIHQMSSVSARPEWLSWPAWVVFVVGSNFFLPALALGTISPVAASLALAHSSKTGTTVGNVYAWGALGSIVGTFLTGFVLISYVGTQHIIWMTAAVLAILGAITSSEWMFRSALLFGWLQVVIWIGLFASAKADQDWPNNWENKVLAAFHQVGTHLQIRSDDPAEYNTESNYFYINVANRVEQGDAIKALHLDHLTHSYYNPANPTKLYYDYERVYAAVTERAAERWNRATTVPLPRPPANAAWLKALPAGVTYDAGRKTLTALGALPGKKRVQLLAASPSAPYWRAVAELAANSDAYSALSSAPLDALPEGITLPPALEKKMRYDANLSSLIRYDRLSAADVQTLLDLGPDREFRRAVEDLYRRSRKIGTLFIGGGGYVFPRWIEANFPHQPRIRVAELDPAVKQAVQDAMGLAADGETAIETTVGDARIVVDDLLRENVKLQAAGQPPVLYDFAYGDAFNDFSVPWHLTTREFAENVKGLLNGEGVFLANIIDIYPRAALEGPDAAEPEFWAGVLPRELQPPHPIDDDWAKAAPPFQNVEINPQGSTLAEAGAPRRYRLGYRGVMSRPEEDRLKGLAPADKSFTDAIARLAAHSRKRRGGSFLGSYVNTVSQVFPCVYVFSSNSDQPSDRRDTFVVACSLRPLDLGDLAGGGLWEGTSFAGMEPGAQGKPHYLGQMEAVLQLARGVVLTDDYAPVDNMLIPVFADQ